MDKGIYWHQGMFMQPQHFQMADLHRQFQLKPLLNQGLPYFWGIGHLALAQGALANRMIEVQSAQLLFPDHSYIEYPGNAVIGSRSFDQAWVDKNQPFTVFLGIKKFRQQGENVSSVSDMHVATTTTTRYASLNNPPEVADLYSQGSPAQVRTLLYTVKIFFENEITHLHDYEIIPIARLVRDGDIIKYSASFIPPCYTLDASDLMLRIIKDVRDELVGRARQLQEYKNPRDVPKPEFDADYMAFLLALGSLSRTGPYLLHLTETKQVHPWQAYGVLRQLVGELSVFSERYNMLGQVEDSPGMPAYDHLELHTCFIRAQALISQLLNEIAVGPEFMVTLVYQGVYYRGDLPHALFDRRNRFYLVLRSAQEHLVESVLRETRLAAEQEITNLTAHALPGLELIHMPVVPQGLPRRAGSYYFRIEQFSQYWDAVERQGSIALQWPNAPKDIKVDIVVLRR